jgi:hypothetical protein
MPRISHQRWFGCPVNLIPGIVLQYDAQGRVISRFHPDRAINEWLKRGGKDEQSSD